MIEHVAREPEAATRVASVDPQATFLPRLFIDLLWIEENTELQLDPTLVPRD